jgi:hypothetical protein
MEGETKPEDLKPEEQAPVSAGADVAAGTPPAPAPSAPAAPAAPEEPSKPQAPLGRNGRPIISRFYAPLLALLIALPMLGASSCEQKAEEAVGVHTDPATGKVTVTPPEQSPAGKAVAVAGAVAETALPGVGTLIHIGLTGLLTIFSGVFGGIALKRSGQLDVAHAALGAATTAIQATASGLQQAVNVLPPEHAATLVKVLDVAHDAAQVAGHLQDALQPNLDTAGQHAAAPGSGGGA